MPKTYTIEQVQQIFSSKNCQLVTGEYTNQLQDLDYIATCGHKNKMKLKTFLRDHGHKCRCCTFDMSTYKDVCESFDEKGCTIIMNEEEFNKNFKNNTSKIEYVASCGHSNSVIYKNFKSLNQGISCPSCVSKSTGNILKELRSGENKNSSIEQELKCIEYFISLAKDNFISKKTFDGCRADVIIKPHSVTEDLWIGIQIKTTAVKTTKSQYYFRLNGVNYENCLVVCICLEDKKMWIVPFEEVKGYKTVGIATKSKYNKYEVTKENISELLMEKYSKINKFDYDTLNTPTSETHKQEQEYRKIRESRINFIEFIYPNIEGSVYDFKIGDKKIQEKVGFICKNNPNSFGFTLNKSNGKKYNCCYHIGDNDLYWLNCKNTSRFYLIPEGILVEKGFVGDFCNKQHLYVSPTNRNTQWCNEYLFDYNNLDKDRFLELIY